MPLTKKIEVITHKRKIKVKCSPGSQSSSGSANECPLNLCLTFRKCRPFSLTIPIASSATSPTLQNSSYHQLTPDIQNASPFFQISGSKVSHKCDIRITHKLVSTTQLAIYAMPHKHSKNFIATSPIS